MSLYKGDMWTQKFTQAERHVKVKAEIGVMLPQAKEGKSLPANDQKWGERHGTDLDFRPPELWDNTFLLVKPPSLWYFVMAAPVDQYNYVPSLGWVGHSKAQELHSAHTVSRYRVLLWIESTLNSGFFQWFKSSPPLCLEWPIGVLTCLPSQPSRWLEGTSSSYWECQVLLSIFICGMGVK